MVGRRPDELSSSTARDDPGDTLVFELAPDLTAGSRARRQVLAGNGTLPSSVLDDVLLLVTELVTNAVLHSSAASDWLVRVELHHASGFVRVAVSDDGSGFSADAPLEGNEVGGWGLALVDRIADRWAVAPAGSGTCAWFEIEYEE
jgi:two-component sensor histidine kinase